MKSGGEGEEMLLGWFIVFPSSEHHSCAGLSYTMLRWGSNLYPQCLHVPFCISPYRQEDKFSAC